MSATPFTIERSIAISQPAARIFPYLNDFRRWQNWSPWERLDPKMERTYSGPEEGVGSGYHWSGNRKAGEGTMTITSAERPDRLGLDLSFARPWKAKNIVVFTLTESPDASSTVVDWRMSGTNSGINKIFSKLFNLDKLVGKDFEKGLRQLKTLAEAGEVPS